MNKVFLGIGTNLGNRENNLKEAVAMIEEHVGKVLNSSSVYETEPWGFQSDDGFLNMVVNVETRLVILLPVLRATLMRREDANAMRPPATKPATATRQFINIAAVA